MEEARKTLEATLYLAEHATTNLAPGW
jgi:hypothetical protein